MPLATNALCSLNDVRAFLQKDAADTEQDPIIESLIDRASEAIINYCGREFAPAAAATKRTFRYRGGNMLDLAPYDLQSATLVEIDTETSSPTTLVADDDYTFEPFPARDGVYQWMEIPNHTVDAGCHAKGFREVEITGTWGYAAVPADVKHAAIVTVVTWMRNDVAAFSTTFNLDENRVERPEALPSSVRGTLAGYKRINLG